MWISHFPCLLYPFHYIELGEGDVKKYTHTHTLLFRKKSGKVSPMVWSPSKSIITSTVTHYTHLPHNHTLSGRHGCPFMLTCEFTANIKYTENTLLSSSILCYITLQIYLWVLSDEDPDVDPLQILLKTGLKTLQAQAWINTGFHRFTEICQIFHDKYIFNNEKHFPR